MVKEEGAENNLPPPENTQEVDRESHEERMASDDRQSRYQPSEQEMDRISDAAQERYDDLGQDYDQSQSNDGQTYER